MEVKKAHALLSPSAAHRWINCTAAPRLEENVEDSGSDFAREGSLAHAYCARALKLEIGQPIDPEDEEIEELKSYYSSEMEGHVYQYYLAVM